MQIGCGADLWLSWRWMFVVVVVLLLEMVVGVLVLMVVGHPRGGAWRPHSGQHKPALYIYLILVSGVVFYPRSIVW